MSLPTLTPQQAAEKMQNGAILIDIRSRAEFAGKHIDGATSLPLDQIGSQPQPFSAGDTVIFSCLSGMRTRQKMPNCSSKALKHAAKSIYWKAA